MNKESKIKLYVVQPNENINSICSKTQMSKEDLLRLNPILKVSSPHAGQPLNILIYERDSNEEDFELECPALFIKHVYLLKQLILSKIYVKDYLYASNKPLHDNNAYLVKCVEFHIDLPNNYNFIQIMEEFQNNILDFIDIVDRKDQNALNSYKSTTKDLMNSYDQLEIKNVDSKAINTIMKNWQLYIIKLMGNKPEEAENIFSNIEKQYRDISNLF